MRLSCLNVLRYVLGVVILLCGANISVTAAPQEAQDPVERKTVPTDTTIGENAFAISVRLLMAVKDDITSATDIIARLQAGDAPSTIGLRDVGWTLLSDLRPEARQALGGLSVGQYTQPFQTDAKFNLLLVQGITRTEAELVLEIQRLLEKLGYSPGAEDGGLDSEMLRAIRNYQRVLGGVPSGKPSQELLRQLSSPCTIGVSMSGSFGGLSMTPTGGCRMPRQVMGNTYLVCLRDSGDCSQPGPGGVTDSTIIQLKQALE
jgi:hypothetical protein